MLRYLSSAYRALRQTVPEEVKTDEATRSSSGWERRSADRLEPARRVGGAHGPRIGRSRGGGHGGRRGRPPPRPITANTRVFNVMVRNAMFQKVQLASRDEAAALARIEVAAAALSDPPGRVTMGADAWEDALGAYWDEHESIDTGPDARSPELLMIDRNPADTPTRAWTVRQIIADPEAHHDFAIVATVDLGASDAAGEP